MRHALRFLMRREAGFFEDSLGGVSFQRPAEALYLLTASAASAFLYAYTFVEAHTFFSAQTESFITQRPWIVILFLAVLGWLLLRRTLAPPLSQLASGAWLVVAVGAAAYAAIARQPRYGVLAFVGLAPAWIRAFTWAKEMGSPRVKRLGSLRQWISAGGVIALAIGVTIIGQGVCVLLRYPGLDFNGADAASVAARLATIAALAAAVVVLGCSLPRLFLPEKSRAVVVAGFAAALVITVLVAGLLLNALRSISGQWKSLENVLFTLAIAAPLALFVVRNLVQARARDLARAVGSYGSDALLRTPVLRRIVASRHPAVRLLLAAAAAVGIAALQWTIGSWHMLYEWGSGTALLYNAIATFGTAYLLTTLGPRDLRSVMLAGASVAVPAVAFAAARPAPEDAWSAYAKLDKIISFSRSLYERALPDLRPTIARLRADIRRSAAFREVDLSKVYRPRITVRDSTDRRPDVLLIVVDSLRADSYDARRPEGRPGLAFLKEHFVSYSNAWSSYNSTVGSVPALLNGALQPAFYRTNLDNNLRYAHTLEGAARLAGYNVYNVGEYIDLRRYFSDEIEPFVPEGGHGLGDPGYFLPKIAARAAELEAEPGRSPFLVYTHLFNLHQPLMKRAGAAYPSGDMPWMQALYEHNVNYLDGAIEGFLRELDASGALDDMVVVITADHGEELYEFGGLYHGWRLNPLVLHVPLFVHYPREASPGRSPPPGSIIDEPVNLIDITPTVLDLAGVTLERALDIQGIDLRDVESYPPRDFPAFSWQSEEAGMIRAAGSRRVEVVDSISGEVEAFAPHPGGSRWILVPSIRQAEDLSLELDRKLRAVFEAWSPARPSD